MSTGRQIQLARLLGREEPPAFLHHRLIMKPAAGVGARRQKLSKSDGDTGIRELRAKGWTPAQVIEAAMKAVEK
jgi:glutamyl-tRNA synthetase/glutamyl-Q tRNA(Asp) synthetase